MASFVKPSRDFGLLLFANFLKANGAYWSFMRNYSKIHSFSDIDFFKSLHPERYFAIAFCWRSAPEGHAYWAQLDCKWRLIVSFLKF